MTAPTKAGHKRAFTRLAAKLNHYRCPNCRDDVRPVALPDGLRCPLCGHRPPVALDRQDIPGGFRWVAHLAVRGLLG